MRVLLVIALCGCSRLDATTPAPVERPAVAPTAPALVRGSIVAGRYHACAIEVTGHVACWGRAGNGRLGTPDSADHLTPVEVPGPDDVAGLAAGIDITCAWTAHGAVWCWGDDVEHVDAHVPRRVPHLDDIVQVVAGLFGSCGLHANGHVACWPIAAWRNPLWPRVEELEGIEHAVEIAGDDLRLCARLASGRVTCNYAPDNHHEVAFGPFVDLDGAISIAGFDEQFAALLPGRRLAYWNIADFEGRRGGHTAEIHRVEGVDGTRVVIGGHDVCVLGAAARCWSVEDLDPPAADARSRARMLAGSVRDVAPGYEVACVRDGDRAQCWGTISRFGDGETEFPADFVEVKSAPLFVVGAPGEQCEEVLEPGWQARELGGKPSLVLSVVAGTTCEGRGDDQAAMIVVAGDANRPYTYAPIETGASREGHVAKHEIAFAPDRLVVDGVGSYRFIRTARTPPSSAGSH
jgi:hypothetical protein